MTLPYLVRTIGLDKFGLINFALSSHWQQESQLRKDWDLFDFKTSILTPVTASELHIRKARNFADSIKANMVLPFANQQVAEYFAKMPEQHLFDRKALKNKLILRKILKDRIGLDSDALGKLGFTYDAHAVVSHNLETMKKEIQACSLWHANGLAAVLSRFTNQTDQQTRAGSISRSFIYRLYLISAWYNQNQYVN